MTITQLIFVRHGESRHHVEGMTGGWTDATLTDRGRAQVAAAASVLRSRNLDNVVLYCSDLLRASESAAIIGKEIGCTPKPLPALRELNNGDGANLTLEEARKIQSRQPTERNLDWRPYDNAETWREMAERIKSALDDILGHEAEVAMVVGHGGSGQEVVRSFLGIGLDCPVAFCFDPASITELRINEWGEREIVQLNVIHHGR